MASRVCAMLVVMVIATLPVCHGEYLSQQGLRPGPNAVIPAPVQEDLMMSLYDQQIPEIRMNKNVQALMLQLLQRVAYEEQQQQEQRQQQPHSLKLQQPLEEVNEEANQGLSEDTSPFLTDQSDKRGSYMSLCHFKICNMGRKRNLRRSQPTWTRM